jgi:hypothetical protein
LRFAGTCFGPGAGRAALAGGLAEASVLLDDFERQATATEQVKRHGPRTQNERI